VGECQRKDARVRDGGPEFFELSNATICAQQARREGGKGESFPGPCDVWGAPPSLTNTENGVTDGFFVT